MRASERRALADLDRRIAYHKRAERLSRMALKIWWYGFMTLGLALGLTGDGLRKNLAVIVQITGWMVLQNFAVSLFVVAVAVSLARLHPFFMWSWFALFTVDGKSSGTNVQVMPMRVKYFGLFYGVLLAANLPTLAMYEEKLFRANTQGWSDGVYISIAFGLVHCLAGVPIAAGIAITFAGLWFTHQFFVGGIELSTLHHTTYNLILVSVLLVVLSVTHVVGPRKATS